MPENVFNDLAKLDDISAEGIVRQLLDSLESANLNEAFLWKALNAWEQKRSDSQNQTLFPNIIVWHSSTHWLELAVHDVMTKWGLWIS